MINDMETKRKHFAFDNLEVYKKSLEVAKQVYALVRGFPDDEKFGLTSQLRRAATSICLNIAEGKGRGTDKDFARFLYQARGSALEVIAAMQLAEMFGYVESEDLDDLSEAIHHLTSKLTQFIRALTSTS